MLWNVVIHSNSFATKGNANVLFNNLIFMITQPDTRSLAFSSNYFFSCLFLFVKVTLFLSSVWLSNPPLSFHFALSFCTPAFLCLFWLTRAVFSGWLTEKLIEGLKSPDTSLMLPDLLSMADPFGSSMDETRDGNHFCWLFLCAFVLQKLN